MTQEQTNDEKIKQLSYEYAKETAGVNGNPSALADIALAYNAQKSGTFGKDGAQALSKLYEENLGNATIKDPATGQEYNLLAEQLKASRDENGTPFSGSVNEEDIGNFANKHYMSSLSQLYVGDILEAVGADKNKVAESYQDKRPMDLIPNWPTDDQGNYDQEKINQMSVGDYQKLEEQDKFVQGLMGTYQKFQMGNRLKVGLDKQNEDIKNNLEKMVSGESGESKKAA